MMKVGFDVPIEPHIGEAMYISFIDFQSVY